MLSDMRTNERWNALNREQKDYILSVYKSWKTTDLFDESFKKRAIQLFVNEYGEHNLEE